MKIKRFNELTPDELRKKSKNYLVIFYMYLVFAIVVNSIFFCTALASINNIQSFTGLSYVVMLNLIITCLVFGMIIFLWFISETNYYKMMQLHCDLMVYLKEKEEKEKRFT
jgi:hypothetical protein